MTKTKARGKTDGGEAISGGEGRSRAAQRPAASAVEQGPRTDAGENKPEDTLAGKPPVAPAPARQEDALAGTTSGGPPVAPEDRTALTAAQVWERLESMAARVAAGGAPPTERDMAFVELLHSAGLTYEEWLGMIDDAVAAREIERIREIAAVSERDEARLMEDLEAAERHRDDIIEGAQRAIDEKAARIAACKAGLGNEDEVVDTGQLFKALDARCQRARQHRDRIVQQAKVVRERFEQRIKDAEEALRIALVRRADAQSTVDQIRSRFPTRVEVRTPESQAS